MSKSADNLIFRNFLTSDISATKALAFSPDIVPHFGNTLDPETLTGQYDSFVSLPLQSNEVNNIFIRAMTTSGVVAGSKTAISLRAVPSELILWPQSWNTVKPLGPGPLVVNSSSPNTAVAIGTPFTFTPNNMGGLNYALVATQAPVPVNFRKSNVRLRDALPDPPADAKNWKDLVDFINTDTSTAYSNVVIADPNAPMISVSTRLHVIDDGTDNLNFLITVENSVMPDGTLVSLSSPSGSINLGKTDIGQDVGVHVSLPPGFDDIITLNIFPANEASIETFAWVSLQASIVVPQQFNSGVPISTVHLLGAQNIVFHDDATTNLKFASPAANKLKEKTSAWVSVKSPSPSTTTTETAKSGWWWSGKPKPAPTTAVVAETSSPITTLATATTGWWFRDAMGNPNLFPRTTTLSHSPDIQPVGISPRSDVQTILGGSNQNTDWSDANNVAVSQGAPNYIYLRGNCTLANYDTEFRLFCLPSALLLYPTNYAQWSVNDFDDNGDPFVATRTITTTAANSFNVLNLAFDLLNPQPPPPGSDHYCLVAESRNPTTDNPDPDWPHEDTGAFASGSGFNTWVGSTPSVCWRNISYVPGGAQLICTTNVTIPPNVYPSSAEWTLEVDAVNAPVNSAWRLTGSGEAIPGVSIGFAQTTITAPNATEGCHFTGLPSTGYTFSVVLQWFGQGNPPGAGMNFSFLLFTTTPPTGANVAANSISTASLPDSAANWPFTVGIHHPGVQARGKETKKNSKGYLGRRFKKIGPNPWPYAQQNKANGSLAGITPTTIYSIGGDHWFFH